jgi:hypothetical protein
MLLDAFGCFWMLLALPSFVSKGSESLVCTLRCFLDLETGGQEVSKTILIRNAVSRLLTATLNRRLHR